MTALGWGENTTPLPDLTAASALKSTVEVGLVRGISAAITPTGQPTAVILLCSSTQSTPTALCRSMYLATKVVL